MCLPKMPAITPVQPVQLPPPVESVKVEAKDIIKDTPPPAEKTATYISDPKTTKVSASLAPRQGFSSLRIPLLNGLNVPL